MKNILLLSLLAAGAPTQVAAHPTGYVCQTKCTGSHYRILSHAVTPNLDSMLSFEKICNHGGGTIAGGRAVGCPDDKTTYCVLDESVRAVGQGFNSTSQASAALESDNDCEAKLTHPDCRSSGALFSYAPDVADCHYEGL